ncbi:MAG TPA: hypothetical protein VGF38_07410 [Ktedonobacterales bacterium]|jgi:hypothetical protein
MRTRIAATLLCLLLAFSLAACVQADRNVVLNSDGSGVYTYTLGISDQLVNLGGSSLSKSMDDFGAHAQQGGGSYSRYEENGFSYWKYARPFRSVSQLDLFLTESPQTSSTPGSPAVSTTDSTNTLNVVDNAGFFSTTFHATGNLSLVIPNADQSTRDLLKDARLSVAITMPNWVSEQHGGAQNGNTVTYVVKFGQSATIDVTGGGYNAPHIALVAGGIVLALALFALGMFLLWRGNRPSAKPAAYASTSPYYMPTQASGETTFPATPNYPTDFPPPTLPEPTTPTPE